MTAGVAICMGYAAAIAAAQAPTAARPQARPSESAPYVLVLGVAQDAGYPQAGCRKPCCQRVASDSTARRWAVSLAIVDPVSDQRFLVECTPDFREQLRRLDQLAPPAANATAPAIDAVLLTHAHIGHYGGLIHFGREAMGAPGTPVFTMPRMRDFLRRNGPWSDLVRSKYIRLQSLRAAHPTALTPRIRVTPLLVPHRDEFSETVGFLFRGPSRSVLFLPDIDKWDRWDQRIESVIATVDVAYLDGTFYANGELPGRDMSEIPHPFVSESLRRFASLDAVQRDKIRFLHLNHTNPLLDNDSEAARRVARAGMHVAQQGERCGL